MVSLQSKKQRLCESFNLSSSEIRNKLAILQSVIQDDTVHESVLLDYLLKSDLNLQQAANMHFKSPTASLSPKHLNNSNSNNSINDKFNMNNISLSPAINIISNKRKRKRNINLNHNDNVNQYTPLNKRRKLETNNSAHHHHDNHNHNHNNTNSSMKQEIESDDDDINMDTDIEVEEKYDPNWNIKIFGSLKMEYFLNRRYDQILSIHHIPQGVIQGDICINKYYQINKYMTNKDKINAYYKQSLNELKSISTKSNIKISLKEKKLIAGKSLQEITNEYKENEREVQRLKNQQRIKEETEKQKLFLDLKKRFEMIWSGNAERAEFMKSVEFNLLLSNNIDEQLIPKRKTFKPKQLLIDSKYMVEFEVSLCRDRNNLLQTSFRKLKIPYTIALISNSQQLLRDINNTLCVRTHFKRKRLAWHTLAGLLDSSCKYSYEINESNNDESYKHGLNVKLHEYQLQSLDWMIKEENDKIGFNRHLYSKGIFNDNKTPFFYSTVFQHLIVGHDHGESVPVAHGGFLCEEMGLGKTIISLALINCNKPRDLSHYSTWNSLKIGYTNGNFTYYKSRATLIIAKTTLVGQWEKEIDCKNANRNITYKTYYGSNRSRNIRDYIDKDIVLTTYDLIGLESGLNKDRHVLHCIEWHRIILDESHEIKNGNTQRSKSINRLRGINKWCVTGTPFHTSIRDLENQLKFIGIPQDNINRLDLTNIARKKLFNGTGSFTSAYPCIAIMYVISKLIMRHKKNQKFNEKAIVTLAGKEEDVIYIPFSKKQKEYYEKLYEIAKQKYNYFKATGNIGRGTLAILSSLYPARQSCSGYIYNKTEIDKQLHAAQTKTFRIKLMVNDNKNKNKSNKELYEMATDKAYNNYANGECPICYECPLDAPLQTPCRHIFCGECIKSILLSKSECPLCRKYVDIKQLKKPPQTKQNEKKNEEKEMDNEDSEENEENDNDKDLIKFDTKLKRLIDEIKRIKENSPQDKCLIFTSFSNSLDWICNELKKNKLEYRTLIGSMTMNKRKKQMEEFANNSNVKVFVLTVRTGAVGITLNSANHVFMLEPTMNFALHRQAINRVYRLGQKKKVFIHTLIMKDSIEERIWNINKHKNNETNISGYSGNINADKNVKLQQNEISKLFE